MCSLVAHLAAGILPNIVHIVKTRDRERTLLDPGEKKDEQIKIPKLEFSFQKGPKRRHSKNLT